MRTRQLLGSRRNRLIPFLLAFSCMGLLAFLVFRHVVKLQPTGSAVLVLDDSGSGSHPPFEDAVKTFGRYPAPVMTVSNLNISQSIGGCRAITASPDGRWFIVAENVADKLTAYETETGKERWAIAGEFMSAVISREGVTYALRNPGVIGKGRLVKIDGTGKVLKEANVSGFDLALDDDHGVLWLAEQKIHKCNLDLEVLMTCDRIGWCAVSVDVDGEGGIWAAERRYPQSTGKDRILRISPDGAILKIIDLDWSPFCVRVDRTDGTLWATGTRLRKSPLASWSRKLDRIPLGWIVGRGLRKLAARDRLTEVTQRFDRQGKRFLQFTRGGTSIEIDPGDRSVWIAGLRKLWHYADNGRKLGGYDGVSASQKWVAVAPIAREMAEK